MKLKEMGFRQRSFPTFGEKRRETFWEAIVVGNIRQSVPCPPPPRHREHQAPMKKMADTFPTRSWGTSIIPHWLWASNADLLFSHYLNSFKSLAKPSNHREILLSSTSTNQLKTRQWWQFIWDSYGSNSYIPLFHTLGHHEPELCVKMYLFWHVMESLWV